MNLLQRSLAYLPLGALWVLAFFVAYFIESDYQAHIRALAGIDVPGSHLAALQVGHDRLLGHLAAATGALSILLAAHAIFAVNRRLTTLGKAMAAFAGGDLEARSGLKAADGIGRLGQQFDALAEHLGHERRDLAASEERLKFALHGSNTGIWDWLLDSGHTYYSPRWKSLLGFRDDEPLAHAEEWLKRVHPDDLPRVMAHLDAHLRGASEFFESEHRLRRKDGSYFWVLERGVAIRKDGERPRRMVGALIDISTRKAAEDALLRSEAAYRSVVEGVTQIIFRSDATGNLTFLNPAWHELTGIGLEYSLSRPFTDFVVAEDREAAHDMLQAVGDRRAGTTGGEIRLCTSAGQERWFSLHARAVEAGIAGVLADIDAQKRAQNALAQSDNQRKAILDLSPDGFIFIDREGRIEYVNPAFRYMTGLAAHDLQGASLKDLEHRLGDLCDPKCARPSFSSTYNNREQTIYLQRPHHAILKWLIRTLYDAAGSPQGQVMYFRDVTREVEIDRMKTEFLSTAAHELRTPMASIFGFSELLLNREFDAATQRDLIETIHRQTRKLIDLINELLDLARIEARGGKTFKIKAQELGPLVLNAAGALYVPAASHRLEVDLPKRLPLVNVDADKFHQCLANILSNAVKYSPQGGLIHISARERTAGPNRQVGVSVRDQGIGMTQEQARHIFDRFYRADVTGTIPGTGLGMALVKEIVEVFGGEVSVSSAPGKGTEVTLWLPAGAAEEEERQENERKEAHIGR